MFERVDVDADRLVGDLVGFLDVAVDGRGLLGRFGLDDFPGFRRSRLRNRRRLGRRGFGFGLAEGALEVVERDFTGTQRAFQHLVHQRTGRHCRLHRRRGHDGGGRRRGLGCGFRMVAAFGHRMQLLDQILVGALGLGLGGLEAGQDFLDAVDRGQDQRHGFGLDRHAVAEFAQQRLAGVGQRFQPGQAQEAAGALDGVNQPEDVIQNLRVGRILLEPNQLIVDRIQALVGLGQELPQQVIHMSTPSRSDAGLLRKLSFGLHVCVNFAVRANTDMVNNVVFSRSRRRPEGAFGIDGI